jgi:hypothetical protein
VRQLRAAAPRLVVMHGHRHVDWIGECAGLRIVSAPSPVMEAGAPASIHALAAAPGGLALEPPQQVREV